jgi:cobalt-zinc-cadmium efflux system protein
MHDHHAHARTRAGANQRRLLIALTLAATYMLAEVVGGLLTGSLALLADAGHMLSDVVALAMSVAAIRIAQRPATPERTYGYYRTEILAALLHGVLLVCVSVGIFFEAYERIGRPTEVLGGPMLAVAAGGLAINLIGLTILNAGKRDSLNVRGAWLHVVSDALGSVGAITAGALIWAFGWTWADPVASIAIGLLIIHSSWALVREAVAVLMEGAPAHIDVEEIQRSLAELSGAQAVHDLHVWTIASGMVSLTGHVVAKDGHSQGDLLQEVCDLLYRRFQIAHATIQIEPAEFQEPGGGCFVEEPASSEALADTPRIFEHGSGSQPGEAS